MSRPSRRTSHYTDPRGPGYTEVPLSSPPRARPSSSPNNYSSYPHQIPQPIAFPQPQLQYDRQAANIRQGRTHSQDHNDPNNRRRPGPRPRQSTLPNSTTLSVAKHQVGTAYGPYSYHPATPKNEGVQFESEKPYTDHPERPPANRRSTADIARRAAPGPGTTTTIWDLGFDPEADDLLHQPNPRRDSQFTLLSLRGWLNAGGLLALVFGLLILFVGYPIVLVVTAPAARKLGFGLGGINGSGQVPEFPSLPSLIDKDTPENVFTRLGTDGLLYDLVFSDEFNVDGRSFYPGDDPFWEGVDLWYWPTNNVEWLEPSAVTTKNGKLTITITEERIHDLNFKSGMITTWNKMCFTTGYIEVSISLPGSARAPGLWPAAWTLGNLGRAGYGATTQGTWPYSYDTCDTGTFPSQQDRQGNPSQASTGGVNNQPLSFQPGQKLSACTCPGSDHPGPHVGVGRGTPEIDIIEAEINTTDYQGVASQSFQVAPYDMFYLWNQQSPASVIYDTSKTQYNQYRGGFYQEAASGLTEIGDTAYNGTGYSTYGFEYWSDPKHREDGYITWLVNGQKTWTATSGSVGADPTAQIGPRLISEEPMYVILNLGMSPDFQRPDFEHMVFPATMYIDYVRIYQRRGVKNGVTCDPPDRPTADYINRHLAAYTTPTWTTWDQAGEEWPRNSRYDGC